MPQQVNPCAIGIAHMLAKAHADAGLALFNELQSVRYEAKQAGKKVDFATYVTKALPAATGLALALELALKVLYYQHFESYPRSHNLREIFDALSESTREEMSEAYDEQYAQLNDLQVVHIGLSLVEDPTKQAADAAAPEFKTVGAAIEYASSAYVKWRYIYEHMNTPDVIDIHFKALLCLIECTHAAIQQYKGNSHVHIGSPG